MLLVRAAAATARGGGSDGADGVGCRRHCTRWWQRRCCWCGLPPPLYRRWWRWYRWCGMLTSLRAEVVPLMWAAATTTCGGGATSVGCCRRCLWRWWRWCRWCELWRWQRQRLRTVAAAGGRAVPADGSAEYSAGRGGGDGSGAPITGSGSPVIGGRSCSLLMHPSLRCGVVARPVSPCTC